ncbi:hypothetical protein WME75_26330 [Sorangium sp. So ce1014]|uniref:hypothetical protein n=1 Tax=Sorangium sp. So ce1014 TaxID=3133326 RepID=UPI003F612286
MRNRAREHFVPLIEFWSDFVYDQARVAPPPDPARHLDMMFGGLTRHTLQVAEGNRFRFACAGCRNNAGSRSEAVCETHAGVVRGTLEGMRAVPMQVTWHPRADGSCQLELEPEKGSDGRPLVPLARLVQGVRLTMEGDAPVVVNQLTSLRTPVTNETATLVRRLGEFRRVEELARDTGLAAALVTAILEQCYQLGWIECTFAQATRDESS